MLNFLVLIHALHVLTRLCDVGLVFLLLRIDTAKIWIVLG